jgi:hypothetical protein
MNGDHLADLVAGAGEDTGSGRSRGYAEIFYGR